MDTTAPKVRSNSMPFIPKVANGLDYLDIPDTMVEDLVLRRLYTNGTSCIKSLSQSLKLSYPVIQAIFDRLRKEQFFEVKGMQGQDYMFSLSGKGQEHARKSYEMCRYNGPAPVSLNTYREVVMAQKGHVKVNRAGLQKLFSDLVLTEKLLDQLGPALISQNSIFLYGPTGNGKTSIANRLTGIYHDVVAIPYAVEIDRQIIVVYDPVFHERVEMDLPGLDPRWVICRRPCVMVGGELTSGMLELKMDESTGVYAAPVQMKANNGMLIIDDFGRQILSPEYLLNRWIVPLDRKVDYLSLSYGVKFEIPFRMTVVFCTNLDPSKLADDAFLRRIQNKIFIGTVEPAVFDRIFQKIVKRKGLQFDPGSAEFLRKICTHYTGKDLRACYPGDIIDIIEAIGTYEGGPIAVNWPNLKRAAEIYFTRTVPMKEEAELNVV